MAKPRRKRPVPKKTRKRRKVILSRPRMTRAECGNHLGQIHLYLDGTGRRRISKTMAVCARKGAAIHWDVTNDWTADVTIDLVNWLPRYPFRGGNGARRVRARGGTARLTRVTGPNTDRGTYTYQIKTNNTTHAVGDPWVIIF